MLTYTEPTTREQAKAKALAFIAANTPKPAPAKRTLWQLIFGAK